MPVAIIGMSYKLSGDAMSLENLWKRISEALSRWTEIPKSRFDVMYFTDPLWKKSRQT
jgi:acyl transferase domain-containing protein